MKHFRIYGDFLKAEPYGSGHIHDTFLVTFNQAGTLVRYILRKINKSIFKNPEVLIENTVKVIYHLKSKLKNQHILDKSRRILTIIDSINGEPFYQDSQNDYWCSFLYIENTKSYDILETVDQAFQGAKAFGFFQKNLADFKVNDLQETISDFHNAAKRFAALENAIKLDCAHRAKFAEKEIQFSLEHEYLTKTITELLQTGEIPIRVTHNDTKLNNVLLDGDTGEGLCVIDLDTVMPGTVLYDFGDMVRTFSSPVAEDEIDISKVTMRLDIFQALAKGYLSEAKEILLPIETDMLVYGAELITFIIGIRFLTDYLMGDVYYKTSRDQHNLHRCRNQFKLLSSIEAQYDNMQEIINNF